MRELLKTSKGKLVKDHKCGIKECKNLTRDYIWFGGSMLPVCEKHKIYAEKIKGKEKIEKDMENPK